MRILHIITGLNNGGAEAALYRLTADRENSHHVVSMMDEGVYGAPLRAAGIPVTTLNMPRGSVTATGLGRLFRLLRSIDPDVVQTWLYHADLVGGVMARLAGKPGIVWGIRNSRLDSGKATRATRRAGALCARLSGLVPRRIVSCSRDGARFHASLGYRPEKMVVVPNGYDLTLLKPDSNARNVARSQWRVDPNVILLGMVARWDPQKDHAILVGALALVEKRFPGQWRCALVGPGMTEENSALVDLLARSGLRNRFLLLGPSDSISSIMNALDLHVLSSAYGEAFPNVVAEAMACGVPCVVTDVGDAGLIVGDTGWVVPRSNPSALAEALGLALGEMRDHQVWERRQAACRARILSEFPIERMIEGYKAVWRDAASG